MPLAASLLALLVTTWGWIACDPVRPGVCGVVGGAVELLGYAFPNGLVWFLIFVVPVWGALGLVTVLDLALAAMLWRLAPPRVPVIQAALVLLGWLVLWGMMLWLAPQLADSGWRLSPRP